MPVRLRWPGSRPRAALAVALASLVTAGAGCRRGCGDTVETANRAVNRAVEGGQDVPLYKSGKPYTRWWWFATQMRKEDIAAELDWMKQKGFGGVEVAWIYPEWWSEEEQMNLSPPPKWLGPEWSDMVAFAKKYAAQIGLGCDFTFGSGWPFGDAQVTGADAQRMFGQPTLAQPVSYYWDSPEKAVVVDHLSRGAFDRYADRIGRALAPALSGAPSALFCDSLELILEPLWTAGLDGEFARRFGYDVRPFMATLFAPDNDDVRYDYMKLISETMIERFYRPFTEHAHRLGAFSRAQVAGAPVDLIAANAAVDVPETEVMLYEPPYAQIVASAAALAGRRIVSSETFTCAYGFPKKHHKEEQAADLKLVADAAFANGVNQIFWHGKPFTAGGKWATEFYATVHVGETGPLADELPAFNAYMEKVSSTMKRGRVFSSVAVYLPSEDAWRSSELLPSTDPNWPLRRYPAYDMNYVAPPAEIKGWRPLWVNRDFLKRATLENGALHIGQQVFSTLYVDAHYLDDDTLDTILGLARRGLPVCLKQTPNQAGRMKSPTFEARTRELQSLPNVSADFKSVARSKPLVAGKNLPDFWARVDGEETLIFFANPKAQDLHLPVAYGQSLAIDDVSRAVEITVGGKTVAVTLVFRPYQSILLTIDGTGAPRFVDITFQPRIPVVK